MIKLNFKVEENGAVKTEMPFWKDILKECSFRVEPSTATIQPYGSASFRVSLFRTGNFTNICTHKCTDKCTFVRTLNNLIDRKFG